MNVSPISSSSAAVATNAAQVVTQIQNLLSKVNSGGGAQAQGAQTAQLRSQIQNMLSQASSGGDPTQLQSQIQSIQMRIQQMQQSSAQQTGEPAHPTTERRDLDVTA